MSRAELQNSIIRKVLSVSDESILNYINEILSVDSGEFYKMSEEEARLVQEGIEDYKKGSCESPCHEINRCAPLCLRVSVF